MSRAAELAYEKWHQQHEVECARDLVVGAVVYRAMYDRIEEGVVRRVSRCNIRSNGNAIECENGEHGTSPYYVAQFGRDWVDQTYQWRWFFDRKKAQAELVRELRRNIEHERSKIAKWEALIVENSPREVATDDRTTGQETP